MLGAGRPLGGFVVDEELFLPGALYLLAVDPGRERLTGGRYLRQALPAAALADLWLRGLVVEVGGRPAPAAAAERTGDATLDTMLELVARGTGSWEQRITDEDAPGAVEVARSLAARGWIELRPRRVLGVLNTDRIVSARPAEVARLEDECAALLTGRTAAADAPPQRAALAALAGMCGLPTVRGAKIRRAHQDRFADLAGLAGPAVQALDAVYDDDGMEALRSD